MADVPLPPIYKNHAGKWVDVDDCIAHAAAVSAADTAQLRERVNLLEDALQRYVNHDLLTGTRGKMNEIARAALEATNG